MSFGRLGGGEFRMGVRLTFDVVIDGVTGMTGESRDPNETSANRWSRCRWGVVVAESLVKSSTNRRRGLPLSGVRSESAAEILETSTPPAKDSLAS